jgi:hypothetical protein
MPRSAANCQPYEVSMVGIEGLMTHSDTRDSCWSCRTLYGTRHGCPRESDQCRAFLAWWKTGAKLVVAPEPAPLVSRYTLPRAMEVCSQVHIIRHNDDGSSRRSPTLGSVPMPLLLVLLSMLPFGFWFVDYCHCRKYINRLFKLIPGPFHRMTGTWVRHGSRF